MKLKSMLIALCLLVACGCSGPPALPTSETMSGPWEFSSDAFVRSIDWYHRSFLVEYNRDHRTKVFMPICYSDGLPVWQGEEVEFSYRWYHANIDDGCYQIVSVVHIGDAK